MEVLRDLTEQTLERKPVKSERNISSAKTLQIIWAGLI